MKKSTFVLIVIICMALLSSLVSCSNRSGNRKEVVYSLNDSMLYRAKQLYTANNGSSSFNGINVELIKVPLGYLPGDTLYIYNKQYVLGSSIQRIKKLSN